MSTETIPRTALRPEAYDPASFVPESAYGERPHFVSTHDAMRTMSAKDNFIAAMAERRRAQKLSELTSAAATSSVEADSETDPPSRSHLWRRIGGVAIDNTQNGANRFSDGVMATVQEFFEAKPAITSAAHLNPINPSQTNPEATLGHEQAFVSDIVNSAAPSLAEQAGYPEVGHADSLKAIHDRRVAAHRPAGELALAA